ncbi:MAG: hypothetical protein LBV04_03900 [Deferribacteraceae bacterium]|jgi:hypothetical protein|nr:hypothetical protein [Deferribacteraceae bacterium]
MLNEIKKHSLLTDCHAILLEDDLDKRDKDIIPKDFLAQTQERMLSEFNKITTKHNARLICLYAAPEIETWFIEDWENGFGSQKYVLDHQIKAGLRKAIYDMKSKCNQGFERYHQHFEPKLSEWISSKIQELSITHVVTDPAKASYSKRIHGSVLLQQLDPAKLEAQCRLYFSPAYRAIQAINKDN